jgi:hypothetical protein
MGMVVQTTVQKVRKVAEEFPVVSQHSSSSSTASSIPDPGPELINAQNFDFVKPKLFFKNIGHYAATSTYIHAQIPFNFSTVFNTKAQIAEV